MPDGSDATVNEELQAHHVRAFLRSIELSPCTCYCDSPEVHRGRDLIFEYALTLSNNGNNATHPLTPAQCGEVLQYLSNAQPWEGGGDHPATQGYPQPNSHRKPSSSFTHRVISP